MSPHKRIKIAIGLVLFFLAMGTVGYIVIANYSPLDAFYMTVITISTVGYGEIQQLSGGGRVFTILLILSGVGSIAFAAGAFTELVIERAANPNRWKRTMEKKISKLKRHVIICGHGRVGAAAAEYFWKNDTEFVVIDHSLDEVKSLVDVGYNFIQGDGTREEVLLRAGIKEASSLLAVLNSDPDNLFAVLTARELNPVLRIIARIEQASSESRMLRAGADSIISPFAAAGKQVAISLMSKDSFGPENSLQGENFVQKPSWTEVTENSELIGKTVQTALELLGGSIVGIRRGNEDTLLPSREFTIVHGDEILISPQNVDTKSQSVALESKKIVFIDDNPVILRLYTRLFQKAGFTIMCAESGQAGYELILKEKPDAAVVDFHLPDMSGLTICEKIREKLGKENIRLFLFTADDRDETRNKALRVGVDEVVVKSPDAGEIVAMVYQNLT